MSCTLCHMQKQTYFRLIVTILRKEGEEEKEAKITEAQYLRKNEKKIKLIKNISLMTANRERRFILMAC